MKTILTHLAAFIAGVISLPIVIFTVIILSPNSLIHLIDPNVTVKVTKSMCKGSGSTALKTAKTEEERFFYLGRAAKDEFVKGNIGDARKYAEELATLTQKYKNNWDNGNAIQDFNLVLGRIAIHDGNIEAAKKYLSEEAKSPGSPEMNSFGPNVSLAKDLLEKGETVAVINYLRACKLFWKMDHGKIDEWIASIEAGKVPNFGANLWY